MRSNLLQAILILIGWLSKKSKTKIIILISLSIFVGILEVTTLMTINPLFKVINGEKTLNFTYIGFLNNLDSSQLLPLISSCLIFLLAITSFLKVKTISYGNFLSAEIGTRISKKLLKSFLGNDYLLHKSRETGEVINVFTYNLTKSVSFLNYLLNFIVSFFSFLFISSFIVFENSLISIGTFITLAISYFFIAKVYKKRIISDAKKVKVNLDEMTNMIQEIIRDIENIIISYKDDQIIQKYSRIDSIYKYSGANITNYNSLPRYIIEGIGLTSFGVFTSIYALLNQSKGIESISFFSSIGSIILGMQKLLPAVNNLYTTWSSMNANIVSINAVNDYLIKYSDKTRLIEGKHFLNKFNHYIELCDISYSYPLGEKVLNNISLKINKGEKILINAPSGFGKTTLINIIAGILKPKHGIIKLDGFPLGEKITLSQWRRQIGYIKQKSFLKSGRLLDLIIGEEVEKKNEELAIKKARYFCKIACLEEFIENLPNKYLEYIKEDGNTLSGGQTQRLAIAICLASNPALVIFDETTSGLDKKIELKLLKNIKEINDLTMIFISHSKTLETLFEKNIDISNFKKH